MNDIVRILFLRISSLELNHLWVRLVRRTVLWNRYLILQGNQKKNETTAKRYKNPKYNHIVMKIQTNKTWSKAITSPCNPCSIAAISTTDGTNWRPSSSMKGSCDCVGSIDWDAWIHEVSATKFRTQIIFQKSYISKYHPTNTIDLFIIWPPSQNRECVSFHKH